MVTRKKSGPSVDGAGSILSTVSGPSGAQPPSSLGSKNAVAEQLLQKAVASQQLAAEMPFNPTKPGEHGAAAYTPQQGAMHEPSTPVATASTSTETIGSAKLGAGEPLIGENPTVGPLDRVRVDGSGQRLTTKIAGLDRLPQVAPMEVWVDADKLGGLVPHQRAGALLDHSRGNGAAGRSRQDGLEPQPRQLLCRDRAGGVLHRARRAGHRYFNTGKEIRQKKVAAEIF